MLLVTGAIFLAPLLTTVVDLRHQGHLETVLNGLGGLKCVLFAYFVQKARLLLVLWLHEMVLIRGARSCYKFV